MKTSRILLGAATVAVTLTAFWWTLQRRPDNNSTKLESTKQTAVGSAPTRDTPAPAGGKSDVTVKTPASTAGAVVSPIGTTATPQMFSMISPASKDPADLKAALLAQKRDLSDPRQREELVRQLRAVEDAEMVAAREKARRMGLPLEGDRPGGGRFVLVGFRGDRPLYHHTHNVNAAISTAAHQVRSWPPFNVDGTGLKVGLWEVGGIPRLTHQEFGPTLRITVKDGYPFASDHATHCAGTLAATGVNPLLKGMAPGLLIDAYSSTSDVSEMTLAGAAVGGEPGKLYVSNHSYGYYLGWDGAYWGGRFTNDGNPADDVEDAYGQYNSSSYAQDAMLTSLPYYLPFYSAGNERDDTPPATGASWYAYATGQSYTYNPAQHPPGDGQYKLGYDTMDYIKVCKNVMTVGAVNDAVNGTNRNVSAGTISTFSSTGPADDGRIKPDVVANGVNLLSPDNTSDTSSASFSGTSMASPNAAGSAMLLVDYYGDRFPGQYMKASTLKGLIIHTADDVGNPGPDYFYGWGLMNTKAAADQIKLQADNAGYNGMIEAGLSTSKPSDTYSFTWSGSEKIRVTLCWTDVGGSPVDEHDDRNKDLINDLNLKVTGPQGQVYLPFVMPYVGNWTNAMLSANATTGVNTVDNVEQVLIIAPPSYGLYTITVNHAGSLFGGSQNYSLIISGQSTDSLAVTPSETFLSSGDAGGPFSPSTKDYTLTNIGGGPISWSAGASQPWLSTSPASGSLAVGQSTTVTASLTAAANSLPGGQHNATLIFTNTTSGSVTNRPATLNAGRNFLNFPLNTNPGWTMQGAWAFGAPGGLGGDPAAAKTGTNVYGYNLSGTYTGGMAAQSLTTTALNCTGKQNVTLGFWRWLGIESSQFDDASVQVSRDGTNWTTVWDHNGPTFTDSAWTYVEYNISAVADNQPTVYVRWVMGPTDFSAQYAGWNIDDIVLLGDTIPPQPEIAVHNGATTAAAQLQDEQPDVVDFGFTASGTPVTRSFTIANTGTLPLTVSSITVPTDFTVLGAPTSVAAGGNATFQIRFNATLSGVREGVVVISSNDADESLFDFPVKGAVNQPEINLSVNGTPITDGQAQAVSYLTTTTGSPVTRSFAIQNDGVSTLTVSSITAPAGFTVLNAPTNIPGGGSASFQLRLNATAVGTFSGSVVITNNDFDEGSFDFPVGGSVISTGPVGPGMPDTSFAGTGSSITGHGGGNAMLYAAVAQSDGKTVAAGQAYNGVKYDFLVVRYNSDGTPDTSFGTGGTVLVSVSVSTDTAYGVALQTDGKILVCGSANGDFGLIRLTAAGVLDTTFDVDGIVTTPVLASTDTARDLAVQSDGKVVVAGFASNGTNNDFAAVRYNSDGTLDTTFDTDGKVTTAIGTGTDEAYAVVITSGGLIILGGRSFSSTNGDDFALVRYTSGGALDTTFDTDGKVTTAMGTTVAADVIYDLALDPANGKIVAAGSTGSNSGLGVARYNTNGSLDTTFLGGGRAFGYYLSSANTHATSVRVQPDSKIVACGYGLNGTAYDAFVCRFNANGLIDNVGFGSGSTGFSGINVGALDDYAMALALHGNGTFSIAGYSNTTQRDTPFLAMVNSAGALIAGFDGDGKASFSPGASSDFGLALALKPDGSATLAGYANANRSDDYAAAQWLGNGTLNSSFGTAGKSVISSSTANERAYAAVMQNDGKLLLAGYITNTNNDIQLLRLTTAGVLDTTFDTDGRVSTTVGSAADVARAMVVQPDGAILVAGSASMSGADDFALVRYTTAGSLDITFDTDGKVTTAFGTSTDAANALVLQPDGKILAAGSAVISGSPDFAIARYTSTGALDTTFDTDGKATFTMGAGSDTANAMRLQSTGKIILGGDAAGDFGLLRLNSNGSLDTSFGSNGRTTTAVGTGIDICYGIAVQPDDRIIAVGSTRNATDTDIAILRYTADGQLDTTFGNAGKIIVAPGSGDDVASAVEVRPDGSIVVGGYTYQGSNAEFIMLRYHSGSLTAEIAVHDGDSTAAPQLADGQPTAVDFGTVAQGTPVTRSFTVANTDVADLIITGITAPAGYTVLNAPTSVAAGSTATFQVRLTSTTAGNFTGNVVINSNDPDEASFDFPVKGGVNQPEIALSFAGAFLTDGQSQAISYRTTAQSSPVTQSLVIHNVGFAALSITSITPPAGYTVQNVPATIPASSSAAFQVTLSATATGVFSGNVTILSNDADEASFEAPVTGQVLVGPVTAGMLDPSFSGDGVATAGFTSAFCYAMTTQADGRIVLGGFVNTPTDTATARFLPDAGTTDAAYGTSGRTTTAVSASADTARAMAVQPDGRIIVAGEASVAANTDFMVMRQNANGTADTSFDTDGRATLTHGTLTDSVRAIVVQADGRIVLAGIAANASNDDFALARFNANGNLDTTYGTAGKVTTAASAGHDRIYAAAAYPGGRIVVAGETRNAANTSTDFAIARYNADGTLDTTFGTGGIVKITPGSGTDLANTLQVLPDGRILVAGEVGGDAAITRLLASGAVDTTFGTSGWTVLPVLAAADTINDIELLPDGRIVATGSASNGSNLDIAVLRFLENGLPDPAFGTGGKQTFAPGTANDNGRGIAVHSDGSLLIGGGGVVGGVSDMYVLRLLPDPLVPEIVVHNGVDGSAPQLTDGQTAALDFGIAALGTPVSRSITIRNTGTADLAVTSITPPAGYSITGAPAGPLPPSGSHTFQARLDATATGTIAGSLSIQNGDANEAVFDFPLTGLVTAGAAYQAWASGAGLGSSNGGENSIPSADGISNLVKFAFNLDPLVHDRRSLVPGTGTVGLPVVQRAGSGPTTVFRLEFIRRSAGGITYVPEMSTTLSSWGPMTATPVVTPLGGGWERVVIDEPADPATIGRIFGRVRITQP